MAVKTFSTIRSEITTQLADNTSGAITAANLRAIFNSVVDKLEAAYTPLIQTNLSAVNTYQNDNLINLEASQLVVILNGQVINATPNWVNDNDAFVPGTGTLNFTSTVSGRLQVVILPKDNAS